MKKIWAVTLTVILLVSLASCAKPSTIKSEQNEENEKIKVLTTIFPQYDFIRAIGKDKVEVEMLLPLGAESHSYEPSPADIIKIQNSDLFIYGGVASDTWIKNILDSIDTQNTKLIALTDIVEAKEEELVEGMEDAHEHEEGEESEHFEELELDEHVWTSPVNAMKITQALSNELVQLDAANSELYQENTQAYLAELSKLDQDIRSIVKAGNRKTVVFGDRFPFQYFASEYGLSYYAAFSGCSTQTEASASTVAFLIDKVKEEKIPVVFHLEQSNEKMADIICTETKAEKKLFHSCHTVSQQELENGATYLSLMQQNAKVLQEALA